MTVKRKKRVSPHTRLLTINRYRYESLLYEQDGRCGLCGVEPSKQKLNLDHDHKRMVIRGLLCHRCNRALPNWVTREWLLRAAEWIDRTA